MKGKKFGRLFFVVGFLCIGLALGLTGYNLWEQNQAGENSRLVLEQVERDLEQSGKISPEAQNGILITKNYEGYHIAAILKIPALNLELPVIGVWNESYLKVAPCLYQGNSFDENLIVAAHNYNTHFGNIGLLNEEDQVVLIDMSGTEHVYKVSLIETLHPDEGELLASRDWELTLFTCTYDLQNRIVVRCEK